MREFNATSKSSQRSGVGIKSDSDASDAMMRLERKFRDTCGEMKRNTQRNRTSMIPIGSKYEPSVKQPAEKVHLEPIT